MKKLRVWWIPQVGCNIPRFIVEVEDLARAKLLLDTLAVYDIFQLENNIKPDFSNTGGLEVWNENDSDWEDWYDEETGMDFDEYCREVLENSNNE